MRPSRRTASTSRTKNGSNRSNAQGRDASVWSAVALQQHMCRELRVNLTGTTAGYSSVPTLPNIHSKRKHHIKRAENDDDDDAIVSAPAPLTLAQRMGLAERPPPCPTKADWVSVELRSELRKDYTRPCAICHVTLGSQPQSILSCSHSFHTACLKRLEAFAGKQHRTSGMVGPVVHACPVCRAQRYHAKRHKAGSDKYRIHSITLIQALWRGRVARREFIRMKRKADPKFAADWYYSKLKGMADTYLVLVEQRSRDVDDLLERLDREKNIAMLGMMGPQEWRDVRNTLLRRENGFGSCPICVQPIEPSQSVATEEGRHEFVDIEENKGGGVVLSCTHCFHADCIGVYEAYLDSENPKCPICRSYYVRQDLFPHSQTDVVSKQTIGMD